jgi:hypothetical protein
MFIDEFKRKNNIREGCWERADPSFGVDDTCHQPLDCIHAPDKPDGYEDGCRDKDLRKTPVHGKPF